MSRYRKVDPRIWNDAKFRTLNNHGKLLFFMLLTHPGMTALGAMRATLAGLAEELAWQFGAFQKAFADVLTRGMAEHDPEACLIALPNFIRYNQPESPNVVKAWVGALDLLPECDLKTRVLHRAGAIVKEMPESFGIAFREAFAKAMPNQEQEQEQKKKYPPTPRTAGGAIEFEQFWTVWPKHQRKVAKDQCRAKWARRGCDAIASKVIAHVEALKRSAAWTKENGAFIPAPLVYLNQNRWDAPADAQETTEWYETRSGAERKAAELGLPAWDECVPFPQYVTRVRDAIKAKEGTPA